MSTVNKVILVCNLGGDPEVKHLSDGTALCNVSGATSEKWKDKKTGQTQEKTEWHNLVAFGRTAEVMGEYLRKGSKIFVEGKLQTRNWEDKDGVKHYKTEVVVDRMQMLDSKGDGQAKPQAKQPQRQAPPPQEDFGDFDDDIPF